ncbi:class I SAM-dependent RNA methyltransferase [archaeon]|nr:class I SAM-dependent RNA methyltransferase [archaeon]
MTRHTFKLTIGSLSFGGRGVGRRDDGKVIFVPMVIPGETVMVSIDREYSSYATARLEAVLEKSPLRIDPLCPYFDHCGGCDWQHIPYAEQVAWKNNILGSELKRAVPDGSFEHLQSLASPLAYGYRCHAVFQCSSKPSLKMGFFMKQSNDVIDIDRCPVINPKLQEIVKGIRDILRRDPVRHIESIEIHSPQEECVVQVRCREHDRRVVLRVMESMHQDLGLTGISFVLPVPGRKDHVLGQRCFMYDLRTRGASFRLSSTFGAFIQANMMVNEALVQHVSDLAGGSARILDLYSGNGNFSIPLAGEASSVTAVEQNRALIRQAEVGSKTNGLNNIRFLALDAKKAMEQLIHEGLGFETIILDPPRDGAKDVMKLISGLGPERIIYISCNPTTLARDVKHLVNTDYLLKSLRLFDMFPQTYHIESAAYLERKNPLC